jgi:hypothetical protein
VLKRELRKELTTRLGSDFKMKTPIKLLITLKSTLSNYLKDTTQLRVPLTPRIPKLRLLLASVMNLFTSLDASTSTAPRSRPADPELKDLKLPLNAMLMVMKAETVA